MRPMETEPGSSVRMCHDQRKTVVYLSDDGQHIGEPLTARHVRVSLAHRDAVGRGASTPSALMATVPGMLASWAHEPVRPPPPKQRLGALLLAHVFVDELHQTVALLKLNPIACHRRLPTFQLLATIGDRLAHWMSLVRNQDLICVQTANSLTTNSLP